MIRQYSPRATGHSSPYAILARRLLSWSPSALKRWISFLALMCFSCSAALAQTASYHCPAGTTLGPWKVVQSLGAGSFNLFPYGPCTLGQAFGSPDAAAAACSPTGPFDANIVWAPQTLLVTPLGSADGSSSSFLVGFTENSYSTINGQETVIEFLGRVAAYCTAAQYFVQVPQTPPPARADAGPSCPACVNAPDPVNPSSGNEFLVETDIEPIGSRGALGFKRFYNSINTDAGDFGTGWNHSFSRRLVLESGGNSSARSSLYASAADACTSGWAEVRTKAPGLQLATASYADGGCTLSLNGVAVMALPVQNQASPLGGGLAAIHAYRDDGHVLNFTASGSTFAAESGVGDRLVGTANGGYQLTDEQDNIETYDSSGRLLSIADRAGNTETLAYDSSGALLSVSDNFGHVLSFAYDSGGRLASATAPDGGSVRYGYDSEGHLTSVTHADGSTRQYLYSDPNWPSGISGVVDESGQTEFTLSYDSQGRVVTSTLGGVSSSMSFAYNSDGSTTETDSLGAARTFGFGQVGDHRLSSTVSGAPCFPCGYRAAAAYDSGGYPSRETDFRGVITQYVYDDARGLETSRTEGVGTSAARTTTTQWNGTFRLPAQISVYAGNAASGTPSRSTSFAYDGAGNLLSKTIIDPASGTSRTWTYTYDSYGRVLTVQDPRSSVTTFTYYTCTTGAQCGELRTVTNALGQVMTYDSYDADGRPLTIIDPNGTVTALAYDARGHLISRSVAGQTTSFEYYPTGLLEKVTLPDGSSLSYAYDAAHRLIEVSDSLGNKIAYTLDAMGNRTAERSYDPSGVLHRAHTRVINSLNEIEQDINAAGSSAVATTFGYDENGNRTSIEAPLGRNTGESYDALNRVASIIDPAGGVSAFGYDAEDDTTLVTDPRGLVTSYDYDGLGDLVSQTSPDSGVTTHTYDAAGNLATSTDARGAVATYGYDALNRVTSISYSMSGSVDQTLAFTYDQGGNGIGHLTGASDANHSMTFSYDALGEMTGMSQTVAGVSHSVAYGYTNGDLTSVTTPSGQRVNYRYNSNHQVTSIAVNGNVLLSSVSYEPFGAIDSWTWGNGRTLTRTYDGDGNIADISGSGGEEVLSYDDAARTTGVTYTAPGGMRGSDWTYGYDDLDRLSSATNGALAEGWTYDADGNRLSQTGGSPLTYSISSASNEIGSITGGGPRSRTRSYQYDRAGNTLQGLHFTATYNDAGRLDTLTEGFERTAFTYNALGEMIEARGRLGTTLYVYDEAGHLLGEYDRRGGLIQETVWLGDIPVATLRPRGRSVAVYYVQTDELDTPREVIRPRDNAVLWRWCSDPFGNDSPGQGGGPGRWPQGCAAGFGGRLGPGAGPLRSLGGFTYDLRFPGQIAGMWGSTFQNYRRDYDPAVGRYVESDPIGLAGGSYSTYAYVSGNPVMLVDPLGTNPGDSFPSTEAAAVDAFNYINSLQDCHTHEYAGWIYEKWSLFGPPAYTYDEPTELSPTGGVMPPMPAHHGTYAMFHNHPPLPDYDSDNYSPADEDAADYNNIPSYLEIPSGVIKRYTPNPGHPREGSIDTVGKTTCSCKAQ